MFGLSLALRSLLMYAFVVVVVVAEQYRIPPQAINFCRQNKSGHCILVLLEHYSEILQHLIWCDLTLSSLMDLVSFYFFNQV